MRTKVVLKKNLVRKFLICLCLYFAFCAILFWPYSEKGDFAARLLNEIAFLGSLSIGIIVLSFMIQKILRSAECEIDENGFAFVSANKSLLNSSVNGFFAWNENVKIDNMPFFGLQFVSKKGIDFFNYPFIAALPLRSSIENTAEIDAILENVPSSHLSDLFRSSPCHNKLT